MFDRDAYLIRIGYQGPATPSVETLRGLHRAHVMTVPFENLNIHLGRPSRWTLPTCFGRLSSSDGVDTVSSSMACLPLVGRYRLYRRHQACRLGCCMVRKGCATESSVVAGSSGEERWLADVGFGGQGLREPFPFMAGLEQRQGPITQARDRRTERVCAAMAHGGNLGRSLFFALDLGCQWTTASQTITTRTHRTLFSRNSASARCRRLRADVTHRQRAEGARTRRQAGTSCRR